MGTIQSKVNESRSELNGQIRNLAKLRAHVEVEEQIQINQLKKKPNKGRAMRILALRRHQSKIDKVIERLQDVSLKLASLPSEEAVMRAMETMQVVTSQLNRDFDRINVPEIAADAERLELKTQVIGDTFNVNETEDDEEADQMVNQLFDELGLDFPSLPESKRNQVAELV